MRSSTHLQLVREGDYLAEVEVALEEPDLNVDDPWAPYLTPEDAQKLDGVRLALRTGNLDAALRLAKVYHLTPVA